MLLLLVMPSGFGLRLVSQAASWPRISPTKTNSTQLAPVDKRQIISALLNIHTFNRHAALEISPLHFFIRRHSLANQSLLF